jgi:leucyl aminopeptidase
LAEALSLQSSFPSLVTVGYCFGEKLKDMGLHLLWAVGKGSTQPAGIINLTYIGDPNKDYIQHSLVGKGIVFDCGGLHVKKYGSMEDMHSDKAGAAAVLAAFRAAVEMGLKINLTCTIALAENSISAHSYRPSDIYRSFAVYF